MFDLTPDLSNDVILLRPLVKKDFDGLFTCAGDKRVWAGHPNNDRYQRKEFTKWFCRALDDGNALTVIDSKTAQIIGSTRFYYDATPSNGIAIGYTFLSYAYWGGGANYQLKGLMLDYAFQTYSSVWLHISPLNIRSQKATLKLGAQHIKDEVVSLGGNRQALYKFYKISRDSWF